MIAHNVTHNDTVLTVIIDGIISDADAIAIVSGLYNVIVSDSAIVTRHNYIV